MVTTASLSAFMSSTGTVAILLSAVGTLAHRRGVAPARVFLPLAFGTHLGSMLTLISTPPNLVVSVALRVGLPLQVLVLATALVVVPLVFPF